MIKQKQNGDFIGTYNRNGQNGYLEAERLRLRGSACVSDRTSQGLTRFCKHLWCRIQNVGNGTENEVYITEGLHMGKKQELLGRCQNQKNNKQLYAYQLSETGIEIQGGKAGR